MTIARGSAALVFCVGLLAGTLLDRGEPAGAAGSDILAADLHVHGGLPLDATLPPWELQREARRRGLDVIAIVGHNQTAVTLFESILSSDVIVLPGVEVGNAGLHLIAAGVRETIDWRLTADEAIDATHRQGGVAIAAHPVRRSWLTRNERALRELDGVEAAHPLIYFEPDGRQDLIEFWSRAQRRQAQRRADRIVRLSRAARHGRLPHVPVREGAKRPRRPGGDPQRPHGRFGWARCSDRFRRSV